jgi:hypothetical protein
MVTYFSRILILLLLPFCIFAQYQTDTKSARVRDSLRVIGKADFDSFMTLKKLSGGINDKLVKVDRYGKLDTTNVADTALRADRARNVWQSILGDPLPALPGSGSKALAYTHPGGYPSAWAFLDSLRAASMADSTIAADRARNVWQSILSKPLPALSATLQALFYLPTGGPIGTGAWVFLDSIGNCHKADTALDAGKLGGQLPSYYAVNGDTAGLGNTVRGGAGADDQGRALCWIGTHMAGAMRIKDTTASVKLLKFGDGTTGDSVHFRTSMKVDGKIWGIADSSSRAQNSNTLDGYHASNFASAAHGVTTNAVPYAASSTTWGTSHLYDIGTGLKLNSTASDIAALTLRDYTDTSKIAAALKVTGDQHAGYLELYTNYNSYATPYVSISGRVSSPSYFNAGPVGFGVATIDSQITTTSGHFTGNVLVEGLLRANGSAYVSGSSTALILDRTSATYGPGITFYRNGAKESFIQSSGLGGGEKGLVVCNSSNAVIASFAENRVVNVDKKITSDTGDFINVSYKKLSTNSAERSFTGHPWDTCVAGTCQILDTIDLTTDTTSFFFINLADRQLGVSFILKIAGGKIGRLIRIFNNTTVGSAALTIATLNGTIISVNIYNGYYQEFYKKTSDDLSWIGMRPAP